MRKLVYILVIVLIVITSGCTTSKQEDIKLTALVFSNQNTEQTGLNIQDSEFKEWYSEQYGVVETLEKKYEVQVELDGEIYKGQYTGTTCNMLKDRYDYTGYNSYISVDARNGILRSLVVMHSPARSEITDEIFEKCQQKAHEIAEKYIDTQYFEFEVMEDYYYGAGFMYRQYIDGNPTESYLMVGFNSEGKLENFAFTVPEGYKNVSDSKNNAYTKSLVTALNSDESEQLAINKVKQAFSRYDITNIEVRTPELHIMPDGKLVKTYWVNVTIFDEQTAIKDEDGNYLSQGAMMQVAVFDE